MKEGPREAEISQGQRSYKAVCELPGTLLSCIPKTARPLRGLRVATEWCICETDPRNAENTLETEVTLEPQHTEAGLELAACSQFCYILKQKQNNIKQENKHKATIFSLEIKQDPESHTQNVQDAVQNHLAYEKWGASIRKGKNKMIIRFQLQDDIDVGIIENSLVELLRKCSTK